MPGHPTGVLDCDVLVLGDEVESILTAVSAARAGASVILVRRSTGALGGLSVRGGLSYMDITVEYVAGLFAEFLKRAGVIRVALNPDRAAAALETLLDENQIEVFSGVDVFPVSQEQHHHVRLEPCLGNHNSQSQPIFPSQIHAKALIDATPDADMARALGLPAVRGLGGLLGQERNFLGISPVFRIAGVSVPDLQAFEQELRQQPGLAADLDRALPNHPPNLRSDYLTRPTYAPDDMDYLDILNPVIGIDYHRWRHGDVCSYPDAAITIDGGNVSRLADGTLGFNGLVADVHQLGLGFQQLIALSRGGETPSILQEEMRQVGRYLRERAGFPHAEILPPQELYVRQTMTLLTQDNLTAKKMLAGGARPERSLGTFSYWLDLRGIPFWRFFPGEEIPKPVFNISPDVAFVSRKLAPYCDRLAFVSRSAGYSPLGQGAGRIIQHNSLLGEGIGIAAALAVQANLSLRTFLEGDLSSVQDILKTRRRGDAVPFSLTGREMQSEMQRNNSQLLAEDEARVVQHK